MLKKYLFFTVIILFVNSCISKKVKTKTFKFEPFETSKTVNKDLKLFKQKCYACHSVSTKSHDEIIAPPMEAVKRRYKMSYPEKAEFVKAVTDWVLNPKVENALMRGAVAKFNVMPKQAFEKEDIIKISKYIYTNEIEKPQWFQEHFNKAHPNGMGNGIRRGAGFRNRHY